MIEGAPIPLWYDTHRPASFDEYVWRDPKLRQRVEKWLAERSLPHLIIVGPAGTGKTSLARLIIAGLGVESQDVLSLNGVRDNNVETIRGTIMAFCQSGGWSGLKIVFFDEADNLRLDAQQMLRCLLNDYSKEVRFIFTGNFAHKFLDPIYSRCTTVQIDALDMDSFIDRLVGIAMAEGMNFSPEEAQTFEKIVQRCYPDMRKAINLLQDCSRRDGELLKLVDPDSADVRSGSEWEKSIETAITDGMSVNELRTLVAGIPKEELEQVFPFCYERSGLFPNPGRAVMIVRDAMVVHGQCGFPHINVMDMLIKLILLQEQPNEAG